jgi:hypothetical protein
MNMHKTRNHNRFSSAMDSLVYMLVYVKGSTLLRKEVPLPSYLVFSEHRTRRQGKDALCMMIQKNHRSFSLPRKLGVWNLVLFHVF